jgi:hypothetical protein
MAKRLWCLDRIYLFFEASSFSARSREYWDSVELAKAGDPASFASPPGYPEEETPVSVWCLLPPFGPVELVPHPIKKPAVSSDAIPMIVRNILSIIAEPGPRKQLPSRDLRFVGLNPVTLNWSSNPHHMEIIP